MDFSPTQDFPALQYLDRVDPGSMAAKAGLKPGDFLLEVGNHFTSWDSSLKNSVREMLEIVVPMDYVYLQFVFWFA